MSRTAFRSDGDVLEELPEYRPLSFPAVAAVILAIPGALGLFHTAFIVFPVAAILLALLALRLSSSAPMQGSGRGTALWAIRISLFLICTTLALHSFNARREYSAAIHSVDHWIQLLRSNRFREAFLLKVPFNMRPDQGDDSPDSESRVANKVLILGSQDEFAKNRDIQILSNPKNQVRTLGVATRTTSGKQVFFEIACEVRAIEPEVKDYVAFVEVGRVPGVSGDPTQYWQIGGCQLVAKSLSDYGQ